MRSGEFSRPNRYDLLAFLVAVALLAAFLAASREAAEPLRPEPISLDPWRLPEYALRTGFRMGLALLLSTLFALAYAPLAAKTRLEPFLVALLDILQSVPILGFLAASVGALAALFPGKALGYELAAVFAVFTSQAWNMAFSFYQSLKTLPRDLDEAARLYRLRPLQRFLRLELPFALPGLVWNGMMSMSGGWFFVVASEAISVGKTEVDLPGVGSYLARALQEGNLPAVATPRWPCSSSSSFMTSSSSGPWWLGASALSTRSALGRPRRGAGFWTSCGAPGWRGPWGRSWRRPSCGGPWPGRGHRWGGFTSRGFSYLYPHPGRPLRAYGLLASLFALGPGEWLRALGLGFLTLLRVLGILVLAALLWVPVGVVLGGRPALAVRVQALLQFLAAFPANLLYPFAAYLLLRHGLSLEVFSALLMALGTQWYLLFNVVAGAMALPSDLKEAAKAYGLRGLLLWRRLLLPGVFPYLVTGLITASGGTWNASIVAEVVSWHGRTLEPRALGPTSPSHGGRGRGEASFGHRGHERLCAPLEPLSLAQALSPGGGAV